ncbi:TOPRIM nucleotidyl transferase/hydrolase domain-containing protein [Streptomyces sp. NPDC007346]|uniref:AAA family ATPase n=1 Tax=Streptomyces sp. NPDC007346 TaxID=3154682 RepID=UPI003452BFA9
MKITRINASRFMSFSTLDLSLDAGTTVVTGPNAVGKSNLGRIVDVARLVVASHAGSAVQDRLDLYARAPRHGARSFRLTLDIEMDQPWEQELVATFICAAYASGRDVRMAHGRVQPVWRDQDARRRLVPESAHLLLRGSLTVDYDEGSQPRWRARWHHSAEDPESAWNIDLFGGNTVSRATGETAGNKLNLQGAWIRVFPDDEINPGATGPKLDFMKIFTSLNHPINLQTSPHDTQAPILNSVRDLHTLLGWDINEPRQVSFTQVLNAVLQRGIVLTDNRRLPLDRSFSLLSVGRQADLQDGSQVPAELYRIKNGPLLLRQRYQRIQDRFKELVGTGFDVQATPDPEQPGNLLIDVTVSEGDYEYPIAFSGAGRQEALFLSTILVGDPGRVIVLDEPGVHIEPTLQRRIAQTTPDETQCLIITHSADLVPVSAPNDLSRILRLSLSLKSGSSAHRVRQLDPREQARWLQVLGLRDTRALLFCAGAVLCEGATEIGSLGTWWEGSRHSPSSANIALIDVGGHTAFGRYIQFLEAFKIPWAAIADGPALHPGSVLHTQLKGQSLLTATEPDSATPDFGEWKGFWRSNGVFSVADTFGIGSHDGEFEAYIEQLNPQLMQQLKAERSKPRLGAAFANQHPIPDEISSLYNDIRDRLMIPTP